MAENLTEVLARAWIHCDPNRGGTDPDAIIGQSCSGGSDQETVSEDTSLTGQPEWKWFVPRAEALQDYLDKNGFEIRPKERQAA